MPNRSQLATFCVLFACAFGAAHCGGGSTAVTGSPADDGGVLPDGAPAPNPGPPPPGLAPPKTHRASADACPTTRPAGVSSDAGLPDSGALPGQCTHDADCTQGTNGRCLPPQGNLAGDFCSYDECSTDAECAGGAVCLCGASLGTVGTDGTPTRSGNRCVKSGCRLDADCGAGGFCSPSFDTFCGPRNGVQGYDCHTPNDECTNDDQCTDGGAGYCAFQPTLGRWKCSYRICAG